MKLSTFVFLTSITSSQLNRLIQIHFKPFSYVKLTSWKRPIPFSKETPRLRRFNLALLPHIDFTITVPAAASNSSQHTEQENADEPHANARSFGIPTNDGDK